MTTFRDLGIGRDLPCFIICEIGQAHDGSLGIAHSMIDAAADAGSNAVKFQTHIAAEESTYDEQFRVLFSYEDKTRFDYWRRMEFTQLQWEELAKHAEARGLVFISSPFSIAAVELLEQIGVKLWKIGSGEIMNTDLLERVLETNLPIIASTGLYAWDDIKLFSDRVQKSNVELALLQCTSSYPCSLEEIGLNNMSVIKNRFGCITGLSDHSGKLSPSLYAIAQGAQVVEVHCTFDRKMFGPDSSSSLTFEELSQLAVFRDEFFILRNHPVDKEKSALSRAHTKSLFSRSIALKNDMCKGETLKLEHLSLKKPGSGLKPKDIDALIGKRLKRDVSCLYLLQEDDLEQ